MIRSGPFETGWSDWSNGDGTWTWKSIRHNHWWNSGGVLNDPWVANWSDISY